MNANKSKFANEEQKQKEKREKMDKKHKICWVMMINVCGDHLSLEGWGRMVKI